jgi:hypothetical protein
MKEEHLNALRGLMETSCRNLIEESYTGLKGLPEMFHGTMLLKSANIWYKNTKEAYYSMKENIESQNEIFDLTEKDYNSMLHKIGNKVLKEYVDLPDEYIFE